MVLGAAPKGEERRLKGKIREQNWCYGLLSFHAYQCNFTWSIMSHLQTFDGVEFIVY